MFLGHFALAFGAKKADQNLSLGTSILAAQWLDLLWPVLLLTGTEKAAIAAPGSVIPLVFIYYPISHSLLTVIGWSLLLAVFYGVLKRNERGAWVVGFLVLSHWMLDWLVHVPDLPLSPFSEMKAGLGFWNYKMAELGVELLMFAAGVYLYMQNRGPVSKGKNTITWALIIFLLLVHILNSFSQAPPSMDAVAMLGLTQWLLVAWGYWADPPKTGIISFAT